MIGKTKAPLSKLSGTILHSDRTIAIDKALSILFQDRKKSLTLITKTTPNRSGSPARHTRGKIYCDCDIGYKGLGKPKQQFLKPHFLKSRNTKYTDLTVYNIWMKYCLGNLQEKDLFAEFSFFARYKISNQTESQWNDEIIRLLTITNQRTDGKDVIVVKTSEKGYVVEQIPHHIKKAGTADIKITLNNTGEIIYIDVYSYSPTAQSEGW